MEIKAVKFEKWKKSNIKVVHIHSVLYTKYLETLCDE